MIRGYNGNNRLKSAGEQIAFTHEMAEELVRCELDPVYFAENYIKIVHLDHGLIPMKLYPYQKEIIETVMKNRRVAVNTSRQAGKTSCSVVVAVHYAIFNKHKTIALLANKGDTAKEIMHRIKIAYEALPKWMQQGVVEWNKTSVEFENGCKIIAAATSGSAIRGTSINFVYIDECAFVEGWDEFFSSVFPTITSGKSTKILMTSTPNGLNHFWKICEGAKEGTNGYKYIEVKWDRVPGRDAEWKKETIEGMNNDLERFAVEFECQFEGSSGTLIDGATLRMLKPGLPIYSTDGLKIYEKPRKDRVYTITVDVSRGKGLDYSAFQVIDVTEMPYRQVATYRDNMISPVDFSEIIFRNVKLYNDAIVLVEINDIGEQVSDTLHFDLEVETLLFTESAGRNGKRISAGFGRSVDKGIRTTKSVKAIGCNMLKLMVEQRQLIIHDPDTIQELSTFSRKGVSYEAESGAHDDLVMCLVLFGWMTDQTYFRDLTDINTLRALKQKTEDELDYFTLPLGFSEQDYHESEVIDW